MEVCLCSLPLHAVSNSTQEVLYAGKIVITESVLAANGARSVSTSRLSVALGLVVTRPRWSIDMWSNEL